MNMAVIFPLYCLLCICAGFYAAIKIQRDGVNYYEFQE